MHHHPGDLRTAVEKAVGGLQAVLGDTVRHCGPAALAAERTAEVGAACTPVQQIGSAWEPLGGLLSCCRAPHGIVR